MAELSLEWFDKVEERLPRFCKALGEDRLLDLVHRLRWPDAASYTINGELKLSLNRHQRVALALIIARELQLFAQGDDL